MKINCLNRLPSNLNYSYVDFCKFDDYEFDILREAGFEEIWYWYGSGCYEGSGELIARKGNLYDIYDLGHCSCYGPVDDIGNFNGVSLTELKDKMSKEYYEEVKELFDMIS